MSGPEQDDTAVVRRGFDLLNAGDFEGLLAMVHPDCVAHIPTHLANSGTFHGRDGYRRMIEGWTAAWEGFRAEPEEIVEVGDRFVVAVLQSARGSGSGVPVEMRLGYLIAVRDGQLAELRLCESREEALAFAEAAR